MDRAMRSTTSSAMAISESTATPQLQKRRFRLFKSSATALWSSRLNDRPLPPARSTIRKGLHYPAHHRSPGTLARNARFCWWWAAPALPPEPSPW